MLACVRTVAGADTLLPACARLTPRIERHPDALVLDLSGCERLILDRTLLTRAGDGRRWGHQGVVLAQALADGLAAVCPDPSSLRVGLGPTRTVAWLAATQAALEQICKRLNRRTALASKPTPAVSLPARFTFLHIAVGPYRAAEPGQVAVLLHSLPVGALFSLPDLRAVPCARDALAALGESGIETLGQVSRLPAPALRRRFGPIGSLLATLAAGEDATPFRVWSPPAWIGARLRFDPAVEVAQLPPGALALLARRVALALESRHLDAGAVSLVLHREDRTTGRAIRRLGQPIANAAALVDHSQRLLMRLAERESGLIGSAVHLRVGELYPVMPRQDALWLAQSERERRARRARLLAPNGPLAGRHGGAAVLRVALVSPHAVLPEERYHLEPLSAA